MSDNTKRLDLKTILVKNRNPITLALVAFLTFTLGLWRNDFAYTYYSAAAQAGTKSWKAFFFGSVDSANFMTVDKPPFAVWFSSISARIFGLSPMSILLPHAIAGVICVLLIYFSTRRCFDEKTSVLASVLFLALPASSVVFRYNLTDSFLMLFVLLSIYTFIRALEISSVKWLILTGFFIGCGFNTKMSQALIVVPIFVIMYMYNSQQKFFTNVLHIILFSIVTLISSLWWSVIVGLTPSANRPYIGSTTDNSIWELIFVHNGFGRFFAKGWKQPTGETLGLAFGGKSGMFRMFNGAFGPNFAWLAILGLLGCLFALWGYRKSKNIWTIKNHVGIWLFFTLVNIAVFSLSKGTIHPYYAVALSPGVSVLSAITLSTLWSDEVDQKDKNIIANAIAIMAVISLVIFSSLYLFNEDSWAKTVSIVSLSIMSVGIICYVFAILVTNQSIQKYSFVIILCSLLIMPLSLSIATVANVQYGFMPTTRPWPEEYSKFTRPQTRIPTKLSNFLVENHNGERWVAVTGSAIESAPIQLSTGLPVMALGGFSSNDDPLNVKEFQSMVKQREVRFFIIDQRQSQSFRACIPFLLKRSPKIPDNCDSSGKDNKRSTAAIELWVQSRYKVDKVSDKRYFVYDLTKDKTLSPNSQ